MRNPQERDQLTLLLRARLLALRDAHQLSDSAWARAAHLRQQDVSRFTRGAMTFPALDFLDALCRVFQLSLCDCLADDIPTPALTKAELELLVNVRAMAPADRHAFERLAAPRRPRSTGKR